MDTIHEPPDKTPRPPRPVLPRPHWPVIDDWLADHAPLP
jgi:hypothetical protein